MRRHWRAEALALQGRCRRTARIWRRATAPRSPARPSLRRGRRRERPRRPPHGGGSGYRRSIRACGRRLEKAPPQPTADDPHRSGPPRRPLSRGLARRLAAFSTWPRAKRAALALADMFGSTRAIIAAAGFGASRSVTMGARRAAFALFALHRSPGRPGSLETRIAAPAGAGCRAVVAAFSRSRVARELRSRRARPHDPLDFDLAALAVAGRGALDALARALGARPRFGAQRRYVLALARRDGLGPLAARGELARDFGAVLTTAARGSRAFAAAGPAPLAGQRRDRWDARFDRRVEISAGLLGEPEAELVAQNARIQLRDRALGQIAEFERTERDANQPVDGKAEVFENALDLAVLALAQSHHDPGVGALFALQPRLDARVMDAFDRHALAQRIELRLQDLAMGAHAIASQPTGGGELEYAREPAVVGEQQQTFGVDVESADRYYARQIFRQRIEDGSTPLGVARGRHQAARLVEEEQPSSLGRAQRLAVDAHVVVGADVEGGAFEDRAVDADPPRLDPGLGVAARTETRPRHRLGYALPVADFGFICVGFAHRSACFGTTHVLAPCHSSVAAGS